MTHLSGTLAHEDIKAGISLIGGEEKFFKLLRGELIVVESKGLWHEHNCIIYCKPLRSDGKTGPQWIDHFEKKQVTCTDFAKEVLLSKDFKPTNGTVYYVVIFKGKLWKDAQRKTSVIREAALKNHFQKPNVELGCLIRDTFYDKEMEAMGLNWIVTMHEPVKDSEGGKLLLRAYRGSSSRSATNCLRAQNEWHDWEVGTGFAFVMLQSEQ